MEDDRTATLISKPIAAELLGISEREFERLELEDPSFPKSVRLRSRNFYWKDEILQWKAVQPTRRKYTRRKPYPLAVNIEA